MTRVTKPEPLGTCKDARHFLYARVRKILPSFYSMYGDDYAYIRRGDHSHRQFDPLHLTEQLSFGQIANLMEEYHDSKK